MALLVEDGSGLPFKIDNINIFNLAKRFNDKLKIIKKDFVEKSYNHNDIEVEVIEPEDILEKEYEINENDFDTSQFSYKSFMAQLDDFSKDELKLFVKDKRSSISKVAIKKLNKY